MSEGDMILNDILASPKDDGLRAVYADWLEDNNIGHPARWEMLRGHPVKLSKKCRWTDIWPELREPLCRPGSTLYPITVDGQQVRPRQGGASLAFVFRRGFLEVMPYTCQEWRAFGPQILLAHPVDVVCSVSCRKATDGGFLIVGAWVATHIFDELDGHWVPSQGAKWYATMEQARDDYKRAVMDWARKKAITLNIKGGAI